MYLLFKFGKHCLTEERATEIFQRVIENSQLHSTIIRRLQQVFSQQVFVYRGSDFSDKDGIVTIMVGLMVACEERMHGVPQLMGKGIHTIAIVLIIEQDKWLRAVSTTTVCPSALGRSFIHINPTLREALLEDVGI